MTLGKALLLGIMTAGPAANPASGQAADASPLEMSIPSGVPVELIESLSLPLTKEGQVDLRRLTRESSEGSADASYALGRLYGDPRVSSGVDGARRSIAYLTKAIEQRPDHAKAHLWLGNVVSENGTETGQSISVALAHYQTAAELGEPKGFYNLSSLYFIGKGVSRDLDRSKHFAERAAAMGSKEAQEDLNHWHQLVNNQLNAPGNDR